MFDSSKICLNQTNTFLAVKIVASLDWKMKTRRGDNNKKKFE